MTPIPGISPIVLQLLANQRNRFAKGETGMQIPTFEEWFEATYFQTFDHRYCHGGVSHDGILIAHIRHSREYMQAQLQAIADQRGESK